MTYRVDVLERFDAVAAEMLELQDTYLACVSKPVADKQQDWSLPVQFRFVPRDDKPGVVDIEMRSLRLTGIVP
jgi:hypothetical protein